MRYNEIIMEQADECKRVIVFMMCIRRVLNQHLLMCIALDFNAQDRPHWKTEIMAWMQDIARIRLKSPKGPDKPLKQKTYLSYMWDGPFGESHADALDMMQTCLDDIAVEKSNVSRNGKSPDDLISELRAWHEEAGRIIQAKGDIKPWVQAL